VSLYVAETLGDFVRRIRNEKNLTLRAVSNRSARFGTRISASYINRIENDMKYRTTATKLAALANGLGVPAGDLFARAIGTVPRNPDNEHGLIEKFRELSAGRREDVLKIVDLWYSEQNENRCPVP
jgi:transcriptional regulator with XRE-family HTH domain